MKNLGITINLNEGAGIFGIDSAGNSSAPSYSISNIDGTATSAFLSINSVDGTMTGSSSVHDMIYVKVKFTFDIGGSARSSAVMMRL